MPHLSQREVDLCARVGNFDRWAIKALSARIVWPQTVGSRISSLCRARAYMNILCLNLAKAGFYFDGKGLAEIIESILDDVAKAQKEGKVVSLFPLLKVNFASYVALNADRLKSQAIRLGCHSSQAVDEHHLVEILGERHARSARKRRENRQKKLNAAMQEKVQRRLIPNTVIHRLSQAITVSCAPAEVAARRELVLTEPAYADEF